MSRPLPLRLAWLSLCGCLWTGLVLTPAPADAAGASQGFLDGLFSIFAPAPAAPAPSGSSSAALPVRAVPGQDGMSSRGSRKRANADTGLVGDPVDASPRRRSAATYRTVCVRLCDGYYWPISDAQPMSRFARDRQVCETSCGQPAALYYQSGSDTDASQLMSLDGKPYSALPHAFAYRKTFDAACRCHGEPWSETELLRHRMYAIEEQSREAMSAPSLASTLGSSGSTDEAAPGTDVAATAADGTAGDAAPSDAASAATLTPGQAAAAGSTDFPYAQSSAGTPPQPARRRRQQAADPLLAPPVVLKAQVKPSFAGPLFLGPSASQAVDGISHRYVPLR